MFLLGFKLKNKIDLLLSRFKKKRVRVVHDADLVGVLSSLGVLDKIKKGEAKCFYCGDIVNLDNLEAVFMEGKTFKFVCSNNDCISKL